MQETLNNSAFTVGRKQLYILPTRVGWYFGLILVALFGIAIKFDNQAAFIMLFMLVSVGLISMLYTHNNVIGLSITPHASSSVHVGQAATFPVTIKNHSGKARRSVWLICGGYHRVIDFNEQSSITINIELPTLQRGLLACEPIILSSQFPIGLFFCWSKRFQSSVRCLVYPQPLDLVPMNDSGSATGKLEPNQIVDAGNEDFRGMKQYQPGDRIRDIHWPSVAKTQKMVILEYETPSLSSINLSWFSLPRAMPVEDKLSQLCFWVLRAFEQKLEYQLEMPGHTIEFDSSDRHFHDCMRTLALWGVEAHDITETTKAAGA